MDRRPGRHVVLSNFRLPALPAKVSDDPLGKLGIFERHVTDLSPDFHELVVRHVAVLAHAATRGDDRHVIRDVEAACKALTGNWPNKRGPSYRRAVGTCEAALAGERPGSAVRITFVVAVMEAGFPFQLYDDEISMLEDEVAMISRNMASNDG